MALMHHIVVVPYDPNWPAAFEAESQLIKGAVAPLSLQLHHVGSTAVPGLSAKPVIDMLMVVTSLKSLDDRNPSMGTLGYEPKGEFGIPGRRFFSKGGDASRTHHVHAYETGHKEVSTHLNFRNYLRAHPQEAGRYATLKLALAGQYRDDITAYIAGKSSFISEILEKAHSWESARL